MRICATCGKPQKPHNYRHPFVAAVSPAPGEVFSAEENWEDMLEAFPGLKPGNDDLDEPLEVNGGDLVDWINQRVGT